MQRVTVLPVGPPYRALDIFSRFVVEAHNDKQQLGSCSVEIFRPPVPPSPLVWSPSFSEPFRTSSHKLSGAPSPRPRPCNAAICTTFLGYRHEAS